MDLSSGRLSDPCGVAWLEASIAEKEQAHPGMHNAVILSNLHKTCYAVNSYAERFCKLWKLYPQYSFVCECREFEICY